MLSYNFDEAKKVLFIVKNRKYRKIGIVLYSDEK